MTKKKTADEAADDTPTHAAEPQPDGVATVTPDPVDGAPVTALPPVVQLDASDDAEIQRRQEARLRGPRQELQAAKERAQSPSFVPAEAEESVAFRKLQGDVSREVRAEVLAEKVAAQQAAKSSDTDTK